MRGAQPCKEMQQEISFDVFVLPTRDTKPRKSGKIPSRKKNRRGSTPGGPGYMCASLVVGPDSYYENIAVLGHSTVYARKKDLILITPRSVPRMDRTGRIHKKISLVCCSQSKHSLMLLYSNTV